MNCRLHSVYASQVGLNRSPGTGRGFLLTGWRGHAGMEYFLRVHVEVLMLPFDAGYNGAPGPHTSIQQ